MTRSLVLPRFASSSIRFSFLPVLVVACGPGRASPEDVLEVRDRQNDGPDSELADVGEAEGSDSETGPCGPAMAMIEMLHVCIDRYEASRAPDGRAVSVAGVIPWTDIAWEWAGGACVLAGKRLCTSDEWGAACGGPDDLSFPWGNEPSYTRCANGGLTEVQLTGSYPSCEGWYPGVLDMIGNVSEWTSTWSDPVDMPAGYITRGGTVHGFDGDDCYSTSETRIPEHGEPHLGFRCCRDPE